VGAKPEEVPVSSMMLGVRPEEDVLIRVRYPNGVSFDGILRTIYATPSDDLVLAVVVPDRRTGRPRVVWAHESCVAGVVIEGALRAA
jgi:hypothetical protein